jgi:DNA adenine methylase
MSKRLTMRDGGRTEAQGAPFLKWAGGKWAIADRIAKLLPKDLRSRTYREPFAGGAAMFFYLAPERAVLSDALADLIRTYEVVRGSVDELIERLEALKATHSAEQFYEIRDRFNTKRRAAKIDRAAWFIYLNKTCFNGLFRTNKSGDFNVPVGHYRDPRVVDPQVLRRASELLAKAELRHETFDGLLKTAKAGDVVYMDPPYVPLSKTASFSAYADGGFGPRDQQRLAEVFRDLDARGCLLALSNSDTPVVRDLYAGFDITEIVAPRVISSKVDRRDAVTELLVRNVARW